MAKIEVTAKLVEEAIEAYEWAEGRMAFKGGMLAAIGRVLSLLPESPRASEPTQGERPAVTYDEFGPILPDDVFSLRDALGLGPHTEGIAEVATEGQESRHNGSDLPGAQITPPLGAAPGRNAPDGHWPEPRCAK